MYAVIKTGGKQYRVSEGDTLEVEHLSLKGDEATFTPVLVKTDEGETLIGTKALKDYEVAVKVIGDSKGDKISVLKYRPKSGYAVRSGHRQLYSTIEVVAIGPKGAPRKPKAKAEPEPVEAAAGGSEEKAPAKKAKAPRKTAAKKSETSKEAAE